MTERALGLGGRGRQGGNPGRRWLGRLAMGAAVPLLLVAPAAAQEAEPVPDSTTVVVEELNACLDLGFLGVSGCVDAALADLTLIDEGSGGDATTEETASAGETGGGEATTNTAGDGANDSGDTEATGTTEDGAEDTGGADAGNDGTTEGGPETGASGGVHTGDASGEDGVFDRSE